MKKISLVVLLWLLDFVSAQAATLTVGPPGSGKTYTSVCEAYANATATTANNGDTIEVDGDAPGGGQAVYYFDPTPGGNSLCTFAKSINIKIAPGSTNRPLFTRQEGVLIAGGHGFIRPSGGYFSIEGIEASNARCGDNCQPVWNEAVLPSITIKNCYFHDNDNGILTGNDTRSSELRTNHVVVQNSEFFRNGVGNGNSHNVYIGESYDLIFEYNYTHDSLGGQLLKSRAGINYVRYNNFIDSRGSGYSTSQGWSNQEVDFSNGGRVYFIGNIVRQGENLAPAWALSLGFTPNANVLTFFAEGPSYTATPNIYQELYVVSNTFVNYRYDNTAYFIRPLWQTPTALVVKNNIFAGPGTVYMQHNTAQSDPADNKIYTTVAAANFVNPGGLDYRLQSGSSAIDSYVSVGVLPSGGGSDTMNLNVDKQYVHPRSFRARTIVGAAMDAGALEYSLAGTPYIGPVVAEAQNGAGNVTIFFGQANVENATVTGYAVKRDGTTINTTAASAVSYVDSTGNAGQAYAYTVVPQGTPTGPISNAITAGSARACTATLAQVAGWQCLSNTNFATSACVGGNCTGYWYNFAGSANDKIGRKHYVWGGDVSHNTNEVYFFAESPPGWTKLNSTDTINSTEYASGDTTRPGARRVYQGMTWIPTLGEFWSFAGLLGSGSWSNRSWHFNPATNIWGSAAIGFSPGDSLGLGSATFNTLTGNILLYAGYALYSVNTSTWVATALHGDTAGYQTAIVHDPTNNRIYHVGAGRARYYNPANGYAVTEFDSSCALMKSSYYPAVDWDPSQNKLVFWDYGGSVLLYTPATNLCTTLTVVGQPDVGQGIPGNGFQYSPTDNGFYVLRNNANVAFLRIFVPITSHIGGNLRIGGKLGN